MKRQGKPLVDASPRQVARRVVQGIEDLNNLPSPTPFSDSESNSSLHSDAEAANHSGSEDRGSEIAEKSICASPSDNEEMELGLLPAPRQSNSNSDASDAGSGIDGGSGASSPNDDGDSSHHSRSSGSAPSSDGGGSDPSSSDGDSAGSDDDDAGVDVEFLQFKSDLRKWVVEHKINAVKTDAFLCFARRHSGLTKLPKCRRTLAGTPRAKVAVKDVPPGVYTHVGLEKGVLRAVQETYLEEQDIEIINVDINCDGVSIAGSSREQFWPILGHVPSLPGSDVFIIGIYQGKSKGDPKLYLEDFVNEITAMINDGLEIGNRRVDVRLHAVICDAPAKSYITETLGHVGEHSCYKCEVEGEYVGRTMTFPTVGRLRTHARFIAQAQPEHHHGHSILERVPHFDMVADVPYDAMHLLYIGVCHKLLKLLCRNSPVRLARPVINEISENLLSMIPFIAKEFGREPREITYLENFKATEHRQILLYTGPVILLPLLQDPNKVDFYTHFMCLHVAARMLCDPNVNNADLVYCQQLLEGFVADYIELYGQEYVNHNVHGLFHLCDDVRRFGPLENFAAWKFEDANGKLTELTETSAKRIQQTVKRLAEREAILEPIKAVQSDIPILCDRHFDGPRPPGTMNPQHKTAKFPKFTLTFSRPNNICSLNDGTIIQVLNFCKDSITGADVVIGRSFIAPEEFYVEPRQSSTLGIYKVRRLADLRSWPLTMVHTKYAKLPLPRLPNGERKFALMPLLHTR